MKKYVCILFFLLTSSIAERVQAQLSCPTNIDFELGSLSNWSFFVGTCCPINTPTATAPVTNRHVLTSGSGVDPYGLFPIVAPGGGNYSMKLGNSQVGSQAEKARFFVPVPTGGSRYSLIYRYAVVFENPGHPSYQQPRFEVHGFDSASGTVLPCASHVYFAATYVPGFVRSMVDTHRYVYYRNWTTASIDLSGLGGTTVGIDFASGDCTLGEHFGYGYLDLTCGLYALTATFCDTNRATIAAPIGFRDYKWYDSSDLSTMLDTARVLSIPMPDDPTTYAVIVTPVPGFGCPDTLYMRVIPSNLKLAPRDTSICIGETVSLSANATGVSLPFTYAWEPHDEVSCPNCPNPTVSPTGSTVYTVTVTDPAGCTKTDTIRVEKKGHLESVVSKRNVSCRTDTLGFATIIPTIGTPPYTISWTTSPVQTTDTAVNLNVGTYTVTITDSAGCINTKAVNIIKPTIPPPPVTWPLMNCQFATGIPVEAKGQNLIWSNADGYRSGTPPIPATDTPTVYHFYVTQTVDDCQSDSVLVSVTIVPKPMPPATRDTSYCRQYNARPLTAQGDSIVWFATATDNDMLLVPPVPPTDKSGTQTWYAAQVVDGCISDRAPMRVSIYDYDCCILTVPNAFTPNGDGLNDVIRPIYDQIDKLKVFKIVNRWGEVVYESTDQRPAWDGNYNGKAQDLGTFCYYVTYDCNGKSMFQKGDFTLVR